ncbi:ribonuclease Z [Geofilum rubicundum JCM 15548]|uniref:Ribonuclease Z n=2 Tax=Geofilum TaxID=1236988 RepID=A0A0E9LPS7_9BACT|nr:ribonuclease Z [Geofilum rubicundum JCM 15548]
MQLRKNRIRFTRINHIFISHLHGDHCFGLMGLVSTLGLLGRTADLHIYGHEDLERIFQPQLNYFCRDMPYRIVFHAVNTSVSELVYEDHKVKVHSIPLKHRVPTCGYLFTEQPSDNHLIKEQMDFYQIPIKDIAGIKKGGDFITDDGVVVPNHLLTTPGPAPRSYAFCSDTKYTESIVPIIQDVDLLYHEATFLAGDEKLAAKTFHSSARQAAEIAKLANAKQLIIGHFSTRYKDLSLFEDEAVSVFANTAIAKEGCEFSVPLSTR